MKKIVAVGFAALFFMAGAFGQDVAVPRPLEQTVRPKPIGGYEILQKDWEKVGPQIREYERLHPEEGLKKTTAWGFTVGATHTWWSTDIGAGGSSEFQVPSTCRAIGTHCYIFVANDQWLTRVTQAAVDSVEAAFDSRTPADPTKGIYDLDTQYFGSTPDVDNDPRIIILIMDIRDGYTSGSTGGYVAGYFYSLNEFTQAAVGPSRHSNHAEIYYLDCNPADLSTTSGLIEVESTTAHEFQHMINFNYHGGPAGPSQVDEVTFINEGMSETAPHLCGYALDSPGLYYANTDVDFMSWSQTNSLPDYSRTALFSWYLVEQFGSALTSKIVQNTASIGVQGYNDSFQKMGSTLQFTDVLKNFALAAGLNDATIDPRYGFTQVDLTTHPIPFQTFTDPNVASTSDVLQPYGTRFLSFTQGTSLTVTITIGTQATIQAVATGPSGKEVLQIPANAPYTVSGFGTGYTTVTFALTNLSTAVINFQYSASGTGGTPRPNVIAYDDSYPEGYYPWVTGDSAAVWFDAIPGASLDSIQAAFRRSGSLSFGIWKYTGNTAGSPLGQLYQTGTITATDSAPFPYAHPFPNWATVNVSSWNIDLNSPFALGFTFGSNGSAPGLMMSKQQYSAPSHSLTYTSGSNGNKWYALSTNAAGDSSAYYLVHAFVHYGPTGVTQVAETVPSAFELSQNYPNPFNPETVIRYALPVRSAVRIVVYDLMGREVASLVDREQDAGRYEARWNGRNGSGAAVSSGIYFYRLQAGGVTLAHKMVILR